MSVAFGSPLTSANTNASFVSRTQDTDMVGKLDNLNATDATDTNNGAIHTTGGLGVEKTAHVNELVVKTLSGSKALVSSSSKEVIESTVTDTELAFVSGVTSGIQAQIDSKANDTSVVHNTGNESVGGEKTFTDDAEFSSDVVIQGNLTVNGTTTTVNSATLDVADTNITVNNGGNDATSEGAGLTVERTGTHGSIVYANALASKFKCGDLASESEIITASTTQTMSGAKTFTNKINANNELNLAETIDSTSTGASAVIPTVTPSIRLTNASLTSVANIDDVTNGKFVVLSNHTGATITILNDSGGTAIKRILTGTGSNLTLEDNKSIILSYSSNETRWMVVGGSGSTATGDVVGPASSVDSEIALFDGTTGKLIKSAAGSGYVKTTSGVYSNVSTIPISDGGTGQTSQTAAFDALAPTTTKGDLVVHNGTDNIRVAVGTNNQVLTADSAEASGVKWSTITPTVTYAIPTFQRFTSGTSTYNKNYTFIISSGNATVGATYTHNSVTYTVYATVSSSTSVVMSGSAAPLSSGTLTKASGTGDASLTFTQVIPPIYLKVKMLGGGGGGGGGNNTGSATSGGNTTFGTSLLTAGGASGGTGGGSNGAGGAGGSNTINSPAINIASITGMQGANGGHYWNNSGSGTTPGGLGGISVFSGAGSSGYAAAGNNALANSGSGGGGGGSNITAANNQTGGGGGAGGYIEAIIPSPSATYSYAVGSGGAGQAGATNGYAGSAGGSGVIIVEEYYQ